MSEPRPAPADETATEEARLAALRLLDRRPLTRADLRRRLLDREHEPAAVEAALDRLEAVGLVDDAAYAAAFIRDGASLRGHGRVRLARDLRQRGVDPELVEATLDAEYPRADEHAVALELARARVGRLAGLELEAARRRLAGFLARRGLGSAAVYAALDEVLPRGRRGAEE